MQLRKLHPVNLLNRTRRNCGRSGATAVEFALVSPIFFLLLFACFEFCRLSMIRNLVQDAAYYAARSAMVPGATSAEATAEANRILGLMNTQGATIVINENQPLDDDSAEISVTITVPFNQNSFLIPKFSGSTVFTSTATMRTERYDGFYDPF